MLSFLLAVYRWSMKKRKFWMGLQTWMRGFAGGVGFLCSDSFNNPSQVS